MRTGNSLEHTRLGWGGPAHTHPHPRPSPPQDPKIREVLGFGGPDVRLEEKLMTVVAGPDPVNTTFLNFMAVQDDTAKVRRAGGLAPGVWADS